MEDYTINFVSSVAIPMAGAINDNNNTNAQRRAEGDAGDEFG